MNKCFGCSKEPSHRDGSFEYPQHMFWLRNTEKDCREWKLTTVDPQERSTWRSGVRSAMRAASQLPGKGLTDVDDAPAPAR